MNKEEILNNIDRENLILSEYEILLDDILDVFQFNKIQENLEYKEFTLYVVNEIKLMKSKMKGDK